MAGVARFGVSLDGDLLARFDRIVKEKRYPNRSEAIRDLIREHLVAREWTAGKEVTGAIVLVYNHHRRELVGKLTDVQHDFHHNIISVQHIHLDHDNCMEIVAVKGRPAEIQRLALNLQTSKGVKYCSLAMATTGKDVV